LLHFREILVDSVEYRCWHEVGHATVCLHLGGDVEFIELLVDDARGHARARCIDTPEIERSVACGGFAAEFYLLNNGYAERRPGDDRDISKIVFHNAIGDREAFWGRVLATDEVFSVKEDTDFMHHAIGVDGHGGLIPIFNRYLSGMGELARELSQSGRLDGSRIRDILRFRKSR